MADKSFEAKIHKVYVHDQYKSGGSEIRLVTWVVNGKANPVKLERRDYFHKGEEGFKISGKVKGFSQKDMKFLEAHMPEILPFMIEIDEKELNKKPAPQQTQETEVYAGQEEDEEAKGWQD